MANAKAAEFDPAEPGVVDSLREVGDRYVITEESHELQDCGVVVIALIRRFRKREKMTTLR